MRIFILPALLLVSLAADAGSKYFYDVSLAGRKDQDHMSLTWKVSYKLPAAHPLVNLPREWLRKNYLNFKVDGQKTDAVADHGSGYWYPGSVPVWRPQVDGQVVEAEAYYVLPHWCLIPPFPMMKDENVDINVDWAPLGGLGIRSFPAVPPPPAGGFKNARDFQKAQRKWVRAKKVAAKPGDPKTRFSLLKNPTDKGWLMLYARDYRFSFQHLGEGGEYLDSTASATSMSISGNIKPYSALFYRDDYNARWQAMPTMAQQEETKMPIGVLPGERDSRKLPPGVGEKNEDYLGFQNQSHKAYDSAAVAQPTQEAIRDLVNQLSKSPRTKEAHPVLALPGSKGFLNKELANRLWNQYQLQAYPAFVSVNPNIEANAVIAQPLWGFKLVTAFVFQDSWVLVDANEPDHPVQGHGVIVGPQIVPF